MNKSIVLVIPLFVLIILFSGCLGGGEEDTALFVGGDEALDFKFSGSSPPSEVRAGELFDILVTVENKGESRVKAGDLIIELDNGAIFDVAPEDFTQVNEEDIIQVIKQDVASLPGGQIYVEYTGLSYVGQEVITEESPFALSLEACYIYNTRSIAGACIAREAEDSKVCEPLGEKEVQSSGAPIKIKTLEQQSNGVPRMKDVTEEEKDKVTTRVKITLAKTGDTRVYPNSYDCMTKESVGGEGVTVSSIKVDTLEIDIMEACGDNVVLFDENDEGKIICLLEVPQVLNDFKGRLEIIMSYKVSEVLNKEISILPY